MSDPSSSMELNSPLNLTPDEKRVFGQLFAQADTEQMGVVTGEVAVKFFERTKLPPAVLGEIWQIADTENRGLLTSSGFCQVLRLIGHYQAGRAPTPELAFRPGPLPKFDAVLPAGAPAPGPIQPQMSGGPIRVPPLSAEKAAQYAALFDKSGAQNGVLPGELAKNIFEKARLPNETLGRIWALADTEQRGALGVTEFVIAMHLIASYTAGALKALPASIPAGLYEAASRRGAGMRPAGPAAPAAPIPRQFSGANPSRAATQSPMGRVPYGTPPISSQPTGGDWLITPQEKASYDSLFNKVDTSGRGFLTGEQAVVFFSDSGLPEEVLAAIWDLADINSEGQLNRDEFAVAMYLIRQQRPKPGLASLPPSLPPGLVPPSMRNQVRPPPHTTAPAFEPPVPANLPKSASEDLFGLDAFSAPPPMPQQSTGGSAANFGKAVDKDPFGNTPASPISPSRNAFQPAQHSSIFKPFMPSSSFGQGLTAQGTGASASSQSRAPPPPQPSAMDDLLGDNDPEVSKKLTDETSELANMSNAVGTLRNNMQDVQNKKVTTEADLNGVNTQKRDLELRLSQFRTQYENEVKAVKALEERLNASRQETLKLQQEFAMIEGTYQDLQTQHHQVATALQADQQENASLKERIRQTNAEVAQLRPQLDKMRSDARQQKGMVAINKKQLATNEGERDKMKNEMSELTRAAQESQRSPQATPGPEPSSNVVSPAPSNASHSTNPFFRKSPQPAENAMSPSGFSREASNKDFDSVFGPAFGSQSSAPPQTSFKSESAFPSISAQQSGLSVRSSEPDVPTPSTSPPLSSYHESPRVVDPPAPPESRQFSSSILPIREGMNRNESFSSSVKASAPASRYGGTGNETPTITPGSPSAASAEFSKPFERTDTSNSFSQFNNRNITASPAFSASSEAARSGAPNDLPVASGSADMPGAFPEVSTPLQPETTGQSTMSDRSKGSMGFGGQRSDPFAPRDQPSRANTAKTDFDAAFAGFGTGRPFQEKQHTGTSANGSVGSAAATKFNKEFPPIESIGGDDDSDTNSEQGFADNFVPTSPQQRHQRQASKSSSTAQGGAADDFFAPRPSVQTMASNTTDLPTPSAQKSPPTYEQTTGSRSGTRSSNDFPQEFGGLLPSRTDPTTGPTSPSHVFSPGPAPQQTQGQALFSGSSTRSNADTPSSTVPSDAYHSAASYASTDKAASPATAQAVPAAQPSHSTNAFGDDFDDGFDDLAEARDAGAAHDDDDFFGGSHSREGLDEFNPVFDSPAASKSNTMQSQTTPKGPSDTGSASASQQFPRHEAGDSFSDFEHLTQSFASSSSKPAQPSATASSHDWDAIFSGLDNSGPAGPSGAAGGAGTATGDSSGMLGVGSSSAGAESKEAERPALGRALTEGGEHDDPILKELTGMGFERPKALAALEKYDYDINKAIEHLSSGQ